MFLASAYVVVICWYSELAEFDGACPAAPPPHIELLTCWLSPRSVRAITFLELLVVPVLFVTHISTLVIFTPVVRLGSVAIALSYFSLK